MSKLIIISKDKTIVGFHPGLYLKDWLKATHTTVRKFAQLSNLSIDFVKGFVKGKRDLTESYGEYYAPRIAEVVGTSSNFWINLQHNFDKIKQQIEEQDNK